MKFLCTFCLLAVSAAIAQVQLTRDEETCRDQEGASDMEVEMFQQLETPVTQVAKRYYSCIMRVLRYHDGQRFDKAGFLDTMLAAADSEEQRQAMRHLAEQCDGTENDDPCELAADIMECLMR